MSASGVKRTSNSLRCRGRSNASLRSQSSALVAAMTFGTKTCASVFTRHPHLGGTSCSKASPLLLGSPYRYSSSPVRPPLTPINGALPTELRAGLTVGSSLSNNAAQRSAEMAVSASQTSFTPGLKLHPPAANEGTIRAKLGGKMDGASEAARCLPLALSGHSKRSRECPLSGVKRTWVDDIHATPRTFYRSGMKLPLTLHPLPLFFLGRFGFVISGSAPDSSKLHEYKYPEAA